MGCRYLRQPGQPGRRTGLGRRLLQRTLAPSRTRGSSVSQSPWPRKAHGTASGPADGSDTNDAAVNNAAVNNAAAKHAAVIHLLVVGVLSQLEPIPHSGVSGTPPISFVVDSRQFACVSAQFTSVCMNALLPVCA